MTIQQQIAAVLQREGGYVNNPADRGGPTNHGITEARARASGWRGDMRDLPVEVASAIYLNEYWHAPHFDAAATIAPLVAAELFDTGINCGVATATMILQRALFVLTGAPAKRDGVMLPGGATITALTAYMAARRAQNGERVLLELLNDFQGERYAELVERDASQRTFIFGWIANRVLAAA